MWISDLAFVLSWTLSCTSSSCSALWPTAVDSVRNLLQSYHNVTVFWYEAKSSPTQFSHLTSFILRLSNELPWRDIPETSNTFIRIFLCYNSTFISFQFLALSFPPQQQTKSYFSLPHPPLPLLHSFLVLWHDLFVLFIRFQLVLYLSFFLIIQILVKFRLMLHKSHQNQCFIRAVITSMLCNQFLLLCNTRMYGPV